MIKTILVALDGSELAEQAIPVACAIATGAGAEVVLATAIVPHDGWTNGPVARRWEQEQQVAATAYLKVLRQQLRKRGIRVRGVRVEWDARTSSSARSPQRKGPTSLL